MLNGCVCCVAEETEAVIEVSNVNACENEPDMTVEVAEEEAAQLFTVKMVRVKGVPIGLDVDVLDGVSLIVDRIKDGFVKSWNEENPEMAIQTHDRIVEVNDVRFNSEALAAELHHTTVWEMKISRPSPVSVMIEHESKATFGVDLRPSRGGVALLIANIGDGFLHDWLLKNQKAKVYNHDRIIKVNGIRGSSHRLLRALHASESSDKATTLEMEVLHYESLPAHFAKLASPSCNGRKSGRKSMGEPEEEKKPKGEESSEEFTHPSFLVGASDQELDQREEE